MCLSSSRPTHRRPTRYYHYLYAQVKNTGVGTANTVTLTDAIGKYIAVPVTSSFTFTDGSPASGLTLGTPSYSNNGGSSWTYTPVSGGGGAPANYDGTVTNWKIIMNGTMNGNGGNLKINQILKSNNKTRKKLRNDQLKNRVKRLREWRRLLTKNTTIFLKKKKKEE